MKKILLTFFLLISFLQASIEHFFPKLDSSVVDQAEVLSLDTKKHLISILKEHEDKTTNQVVVVILNNLHGYEIEDFSYKLARHWAIGQKDKNNGILLFAAIENKKLRIEVGYGLEGALTDKIAHEIIEYTLKPNFKKQNFDKGITQGVNKILEAINGEYKNEYPESSSRQEHQNPYSFFIFFIIIFLSMLLNGVSKTIEHQKMYKISKAISSSAFISIFATSIFNLEYLAYVIFIILSIVIFVITKNANFKELKEKRSKNYNNNSNNSGSRSSSRSFSGGGGSFGGGGASGGW